MTYTESFAVSLKHAPFMQFAYGFKFEIDVI